MQELPRLLYLLRKRLGLGVVLVNQLAHAVQHALPHELPKSRKACIHRSQERKQHRFVRLRKPITTTEKALKVEAFENALLLDPHSCGKSRQTSAHLVAMH